MAITANDLNNKPLTAILAPKSIEQIILLPRVKDEIDKGLHNNLLFYGPPGMGKSTLAALISEKYVVKYVNASLNGNIDNLRGELLDFVTENSIVFEKIDKKIIYLDEFDGASASFYDAFRGFTEQYKHVTFIATANKFYKLSKHEYIESRFTCIPFLPQDEAEKTWLMNKYKARFKSIATGVGLKFENQDVEDYVCKTKFPDFRGIYKFIQSAYKRYGNKEVITMDMVSNTIHEFVDLYKMIFDTNTKPDKFHEYLMLNYSDKTDDVILSLDTTFVNYLRDNKPQFMNAVPDIIIENARHQHMYVTALDQTTVMKSLCFILNNIIKKYGAPAPTQS